MGHTVTYNQGELSVEADIFDAKELQDLIDELKAQLDIMRTAKEPGCTE